MRSCPSPKHDRVSRGAPLIPVMEATDLGDGDDVTNFRRLTRPGMRRILGQRQMGPCSMIVRDVSGQHAAQMRLAEDDDMIETLAAHGSDQALHVRIHLSGRLHRLRAIQHKSFGSRIPSIRCRGVRFV